LTSGIVVSFGMMHDPDDPDDPDQRDQREAPRGLRPATAVRITVLSFVTDLQPDVRKEFPEVEGSGGWVDAGTLREPTGVP